MSLLNYHNIAIFSDAKSVLNSIANFGISSSCHVLDVVNKVSQLAHQNINVNFVWIKAHCGFPHNEKVDKLAKSTIADGNTSLYKIQSSDLHVKYKKILYVKWQRRYENAYSDKSTNYFLLNPLISKPKWHKGLSISRHFYITITHLQFNHGRFPSHLHKIKIIESDLCECGDIGDINHLLFNCRLKQK